jgi:hypothetical protein
MHKSRAILAETDSSEHRASNAYKGHNEAFSRDNEINKNSTNYIYIYIYILLSHQVITMTSIISTQRLPTMMAPIKYKLEN